MVAPAKITHQSPPWSKDDQTLAMKATAIFLTTTISFICVSCTGKKYQVSKLDIPGEAEIRIVTDYYYENDRKYYYQITQKGQINVPTTYICNGGDPANLQFSLVSAQPGEVVGVVESRKPNDVLILYDTHSGESWPHALDSESFDKQESRGLNLLH